MTASVELRLEGSMDHLRIVWQTGATLLESVPFREDPEGTRYNVLLAVQEMLTNVLRHGYHGDESRPVHVRFEADRHGISVEIRDRGPEFNPVSLESEPDEGGVPEVEGGFGIMITKVVMDDLSYLREGEWNVLQMSKSSQAATSALNRE